MWRFTRLGALIISFTADPQYLTLGLAHHRCSINSCWNVIMHVDMAMWACNFYCLSGVSFHVTQMTKWILNRFSPWAEESLRLVSPRWASRCHLCNSDEKEARSRCYVGTDECHEISCHENRVAMAFQKTQQCRLTAGRVNNSSQLQPTGLAATTSPWSYIICKRNIYFFFLCGKWNTGFLDDRAFHLDVFDLQLACGKARRESGPKRLSSCLGQREWLHDKGWIWRKG